MSKLILVIALTCAAIQAQVTAAKPSVRAYGTGNVASAPDQATAYFSVDTRATTAQDAAAQNASQTSAVIAALQALLGATANIQTVNYSLSPIYSSSTGGTTITGYTVSNTVQATITTLGSVGRTIDTAIQAGANRVQSLVFGLKDPEPVQLQALRQATQRARTHAEAMVGGAGFHLGAVLTITEGTVVTPVTSRDLTASATATTPILPESVNVIATVTMEFEIVP